MKNNLVNSHFDAQWTSNVKGVVWATQYALKDLINSKNHPSVITTSSVSSRNAVFANTAYSVAKSAQETLIKNMAVEFAHYGIRFFAVVPGVIDTSVWDSLGKERVLDKLKPIHPMNRIGKSEEVAGVVLFLSSSRASFMTGSAIPVDGGSLSVGSGSYWMLEEFPDPRKTSDAIKQEL